MSRSANSLTNPLYIITFAHWFLNPKSIYVDWSHYIHRKSIRANPDKEFTLIEKRYHTILDFWYFHHHSWQSKSYCLLIRFGYVRNSAPWYLVVIAVSKISYWWFHIEIVTCGHRKLKGRAHQRPCLFLFGWAIFMESSKSVIFISLMIDIWMKGLPWPGRQWPSRFQFSCPFE